MSGIHNRLARAEQALRDRPDPANTFAALVDGPYDPALSLRENLLRAEFPPGAIPPKSNDENY